MSVTSVHKASSERKKQILGKNRKNFYCFLFHDVLVLCTVKKFLHSRGESAKKTFEHVETIYLTDLRVYFTLDTNLTCCRK